jgi:hypothetical protein
MGFHMSDVIERMKIKLLTNVFRALFFMCMVVTPYGLALVIPQRRAKHARGKVGDAEGWLCHDGAVKLSGRKAGLSGWRGPSALSFSFFGFRLTGALSGGSSSSSLCSLACGFVNVAAGSGIHLFLLARESGCASALSGGAQPLPPA